MQNLIVGVDGSEGARAAIQDALDLAHELEAKVTFVYVSDAPLPFVGDPFYQRAVTEELGTGRAALAAAQELADEAGVEYETELIGGDPAEELVSFARARDADLIVVGSRGLGAVRGALLGSVSRWVTQHADRPVLVVKHEPAPKRLFVNA